MQLELHMVRGPVLAMRMNPAVAPAALGLAVALSLVAPWASGCTSTDLLPVSHTELLERQQLIAEVCTPAPVSEDVPHKVLFVVDTSLSNDWNDPTGNREGAIRDAINGEINHLNVSFGIITFSDEPRRQTYGFTRDPLILNGATQNVSKAQGGTNYSDTMWVVIDFITTDVNNLTASEAARTQYLVYWLSDGFPTVGVTDQSVIVAGADYLVTELADRVGGIELNTAYLGAIATTPPAEVAAATSLLIAMAAAGGGQFTDIPNGEDFDFNINVTPGVVELKLLLATMYNRHSRFGALEPQADSDADGLSDAEEAELGTNRINSDSDGDGYRDGVETRVPGLDPAVFNPGGCPDNPKDDDHDGLTNCEEFALGTSISSPDSDLDYLLDRFEVFGDSSPLIDDPTFDFDQDGIPDQEEVLLHLDPLLPNTSEDLAQWGYQYEIIPTTELEPGRPCYEIRATNLALSDTHATADHPAGANITDVVVAFGSESNTTARFFVVELRSRYLRDIDLYEPVDGRFEVGPDEFAVLEQ